MNHGDPIQSLSHDQLLGWIPVLLVHSMWVHHCSTCYGSASNPWIGLDTSPCAPKSSSTPRSSTRIVTSSYSTTYRSMQLMWYHHSMIYRLLNSCSQHISYNSLVPYLISSLHHHEPNTLRCLLFHHDARLMLLLPSIPRWPLWFTTWIQSHFTWITSSRTTGY